MITKIKKSWEDFLNTEFSTNSGLKAFASAAAHAHLYIYNTNTHGIRQHFMLTLHDNSVTIAPPNWTSNLHQIQMKS